MHEPYDEDADQEISKSERKRESQAAQDLGEKLVQLPASQLKQIPMPDELRDAIALARRITQRGGHRRQLQYIGKLMRGLDTDPIRTALDRLENRDAEAVAQLHRAERWRDRLLAEGDAALEELVNGFPAVDRQHIRQLIRSAQQEQAKSKPPRSARELFRLLKALGV